MTFEILSILVVLNLGVTFSLWRTAARRPLTAEKKFLQKLMRSEPITPKHNPPKVAGGDFAVVASDAYRQFFSDFTEFADVVNWWLFRRGLWKPVALARATGRRCSGLT